MSVFKEITKPLLPYYKGLPIIIATVAGSLLIARYYLKWVTPMYESTAKIKLADRHEGIGNSNLYKDLDVFVTSNKVSGEVELMKSNVILKKAISKLNLRTKIYRVGDIHKTELYNQSPIIIKADISDCKWADRPFGVTIKTDSLYTLTLPTGDHVDGKMNQLLDTKCGPVFIYLNTELLRNNPGIPLNDRFEFTVYSDQNIMDEISANLDVMSVDKEVSVLRISYKSPVAQKSADIVNSVSAAYIADYIDEKYRSADTASIFLDKQLKEFSGKLSASEGAIEDYRVQHNIINIPQETETNLRKVADMKKQLSSVEMNLSAVDSLSNYMAHGKKNAAELAPNFEDFNDQLSTEMVKTMKELQREKKDLLLRFTPEDEKVKALDEKIHDLCNYLNQNIKNTKSNLQVKYASLKQDITDAEKAFIGLPTKEKTMKVMERNSGLNEQIYRFLHEKRTEAEIAKAATISFHRIISEGEVPKKPVSPNPTLIEALATFMGFLMGITLIFLVHTLKGRVNNEETIYKSTDIPVGQAIPLLANTVERSNFFRKWALQLELKGLLQNGALLTLSSFNNEEGKRFAAGNLAQGVTALGKKVLLIDADGSMKNNGGPHYFNLQTLASNWQEPAIWRQQVQEWKKTYDVLVLKNFSIEAEPSSLLLMADAQSNLLILDSLKTKKAIINEVDVMKKELHLTNLEFVFNRANYTPGLFTQMKVFVQKKWGKQQA